MRQRQPPKDWFAENVLIAKNKQDFWSFLHLGMVGNQLVCVADANGKMGLGSVSRFIVMQEKTAKMRQKHIGEKCRQCPKIIGDWKQREKGVSPPAFFHYDGAIWKTN